MRELSSEQGKMRSARGEPGVRNRWASGPLLNSRIRPNDYGEFVMNEQERIRGLLVRQYEYLQYLFEQEQKRAASIVGGAKVYIAFLVFILGSIFLKAITPEKILALFSNFSIESWLRFTVVSLIILSAIALSLALLFTILVLKVWFYERLCDPIERFKETLTMKDEIEVLSKSISDLAVATSRNNLINNKRAEYLTWGLNSLIIGAVLSIIAIFTLNLIMI